MSALSARTAPSMDERISQSRILMVGAGGIGCELLKDLVMAGFGSIELVDLDTIDLSNLNRQFLFRHEHIKRSKALVAKESASKFNPNVDIIAHHANIKDPQFGADWFSNFDIIFNALDNLEARRHVNQMSLVTGVPLIDCGTAGYQGQVQVIQPGHTECYDCNPKATPKTFPVCTIRSTPSKPIHCIVWAKSFLFVEVFGTADSGIAQSGGDIDNDEDGTNLEELSELRRETEELQRIRQSIGSSEFARLVFNKVFSTDINRLRGMQDMWEGKTMPISLSYDDIAQLPLSDSPESIVRRDRTVWSLRENLAVFEDSMSRLSRRLLSLREKSAASADRDDNEISPTGPILSFDKDDIDTLDFVATCANLRSHIFGIPLESKFEIKQMAGNIIPAIATTNAIVSGLGVLQALKVLEQKFDEAKSIFLCRTGYNGRMFSGLDLYPRHPECSSCALSVYVRVSVDLDHATLEDIADTIRTELKYTSIDGEDGQFSIATSNGAIIYDPDLEDNLPRKLYDMDVRQGDFLTVVDDADDDAFKNVVLVVCPLDGTGAGEAGTAKHVVLRDQITLPRQPAKPETSTDAVFEDHEHGLEPVKETVHTEDDSVVVLDDEPDIETTISEPTASRKRRFSDRSESVFLREESTGREDGSSTLSLTDHSSNERGAKRQKRVGKGNEDDPAKSDDDDGNAYEMSQPAGSDTGDSRDGVILLEDDEDASSDDFPVGQTEQQPDLGGQDDCSSDDVIILD